MGDCWVRSLTIHIKVCICISELFCFLLLPSSRSFPSHLPQLLSPDSFPEYFPWNLSQSSCRLPSLQPSHLRVTIFVCLRAVPTACLDLLPCSEFNSLVCSTSQVTPTKKKKATATKPTQPQNNNKTTIQHCTRSSSPPPDPRAHLFYPKGVSSSLGVCFHLNSSKRQGWKKCLVWMQTLTCRKIFIKQCKGCSVQWKFKKSTNIDTVILPHYLFNGNRKDAKWALQIIQYVSGLYRCNHAF